MQVSIRQILILISLLVIVSGTVEPQTASGNPSKQFVVGPSAVLMPEGVFLLIRKGRKTGAIRFTKIDRKTDGTGKATYESYFQSDGSNSFQPQTLRKRTGEINVKPLKGFHPFAFQFGNTKVKIGEWSFEAYSPGLLFMYPYGASEKDHGYEFAPTSAQSVGEIDALDGRLKWYQYNADTRTTLLVSELPK